MNDVKILDCTLRDGGYYNNWEFDPRFVDEYLSCMSAVGIGYVEIGLRSTDKTGSKGQFAYTPESLLEKIIIPEGLQLAVMINAGEFLFDNVYDPKLLKELFHHSKDSKISVVRIACHYHEIFHIKQIVEYLQNQGYEVIVNLMQISTVTLEQISDATKYLSGLNLKAFYVADSLGSIDRDELDSVIKVIKSQTKMELGIHLHDNLCTADVNSLKSISHGVTWIDCTVTGMGRGPGNAKTEYILLGIKENGYLNPGYKQLYSFIENSMAKLKSKYKWGTNPFYYLSGLNSVHPTFVQNMLSDVTYDPPKIFDTILKLGALGGSKFKRDLIADVNYICNHPENENTFSNRNKIENILILGPGKKLKNNINAIYAFIDKYKPYVISLNFNQDIDQNKIDAYVMCAPINLIACELNRVEKDKIIMPRKFLEEFFCEFVWDECVNEFNVSIKSDSFSICLDRPIIPYAMALPYALVISATICPDKIYIAGFDGYEHGDARNSKNQKIFDLYKSCENSVEIISLLDTRYDLKKESVYGKI